MSAAAARRPSSYEWMGQALQPPPPPALPLELEEVVLVLALPRWVRGRYRNHSVNRTPAGQAAGVVTVSNTFSGIPMMKEACLFDFMSRFSTEKSDLVILFRKQRTVALVVSGLNDHAWMCRLLSAAWRSLLVGVAVPTMTGINCFLLRRLFTTS